MPFKIFADPPTAMALVPEADAPAPIAKSPPLLHDACEPIAVPP